MKAELEKTMKLPAEEIAQAMDETLEQEAASGEESMEDIVELEDIMVDLNDVADRDIEEELDAAVDESLEKSSLEEAIDEAFEKEKLEETDSFIEEDVLEENLVKENLAEENFPKQNLSKQNYMEENFAKEISMAEDLVEADAAKEDSVEEKKVSLESTRKMPSWKEFEKERFMRQKTSSIPEVPLPEDLDLFEDDPDKMVYESLTDKQKSIFSYFVPVKGMEDQLCKALTGMTNHLRRREAATSGNLIITGEQGCGKTVLATSILKVLQEETGFLTGKVGKIDASSLNQKDIKDVVEKVKGGCLIIEKAGDLNQATVYALALLMEKDTSNTVYILEDTSKGIRKVLAREQIFTDKFTEKISVPIFTNEELVVFARAYSNELGYKIDDMAELALHNRISKIQRLDQATTLTQVKEIVDEAIDKEAHGGLKKAISILTAKRYTEDDKIVLTERNFE